jgi:CoA:oxalate CoA-transferase
MQDATYASLASNLGVAHARGRCRPGTHRQPPWRPRHLSLQCLSDDRRLCVLNAPSDHHFRAILDVMGRSDLKRDPRFLARSTRVANFAALDELIEGWTKTLTKNKVARRMSAARVPCAPVRNHADVMHDENRHARGSLQWINHPELGPVARL